MLVGGGRTLEEDREGSFFFCVVNHMTSRSLAVRTHLGEGGHSHLPPRGLYFLSFVLRTPHRKEAFKHCHWKRSCVLVALPEESSTHPSNCVCCSARATWKTQPTSVQAAVYSQPTHGLSKQAFAIQGMYAVARTLSGALLLAAVTPVSCLESGRRAASATEPWLTYTLVSTFCVFSFRVLTAVGTRAGGG